MWSMLWPVAAAVLSNTFYNICQKSTPQLVNPFCTLSVTYLVAAAVSIVLFLATAGASGVPAEVRKLNWTSFVLGMAIVGLEIGFLFLYRAGWKISVGSLVCNVALAVVLVIVGMAFYGEKITPKQIAGMLLCVGGLALLNG